MLTISLIGAGVQAKLVQKILIKHKDIKINFILVRKNKKNITQNLLNL